MEFRNFGNSGLKVPLLSFGTGTFGGKGEFFGGWGQTDVKEADELIGMCLDHGVNFFDTADVYSAGASEEILGQVVKNKRHKVLISTKATFTMGDGPNDKGSSRHHLLKACEASLRRLGTDYIDIYHMHAFDALTPQEETLRTLTDLVRSGKVRYIACSNFSGWHLMKALSVSERERLEKYCVHQVYYSLLNREYEWELMPLAVDQKLGAMIWSPLGWGRLTGKIRRGQELPQVSRLRSKAAFDGGPQPTEEHLYRVVDALEMVAKEVGKSIPQVALNWLFQRPTIANVIIGARTKDQLKENLGSVGWNLTHEQVKRLDEATEVPATYPYWHQFHFTSRNPRPV